MSRWLQRLSSGSLRSKARLPEAVTGSTCSKRKVHAQSITSNRSSNKSSTESHYAALLSSDNDFTDREDELCRRSYQLVVLKLQTSERETSLTQRFEHLSREKTKSPAEARYFEEELDILLAEWDEIREVKARLAEQHSHLEIAIELLITDKERLAKGH